MKTIEQLETELRDALARERQLREALVTCQTCATELGYIGLPLQAIRAALSTPAPRVFTAEEVRPLVEALVNAPTNHTCEYVRCPDETLKTKCDCWQSICIKAITYARKLGMEGGECRRIIIEQLADCRDNPDMRVLGDSLDRCREKLTAYRTVLREIKAQIAELDKWEEDR